MSTNYILYHAITFFEKHPTSTLLTTLHIFGLCKVCNSIIINYLGLSKMKVNLFVNFCKLIYFNQTILSALTAKKEFILTISKTDL